MKHRDFGSCSIYDWERHNVRVREHLGLAPLQANLLREVAAMQRVIYSRTKNMVRVGVVGHQEGVFDAGHIAGIVAKACNEVRGRHGSKIAICSGFMGQGVLASLFSQADEMRWQSVHILRSSREMSVNPAHLVLRFTEDEGSASQVITPFIDSIIRIGGDESACEAVENARSLGCTAFEFDL
jgi:hypothetical protein